jgi:hypothetical protein
VASAKIIIITSRVQDLDQGLAKLQIPHQVSRDFFHTLQAVARESKRMRMRVVWESARTSGSHHRLCFAQALDLPRTTPVLAVPRILVEVSSAEPAVALVVLEVRQDCFNALESPRSLVSQRPAKT